MPMLHLHMGAMLVPVASQALTEAAGQVRFGVLNAGNFGVSQSRKRTFIWGVAPGSHMPDWPSLLHVFRSPQLTINLPGGVQASPSLLPE